MLQFPLEKRHHKLGQENGLMWIHRKCRLFTEDRLKKYAAVIFLNTTGNMLNNYQEADLNDIYSQVVVM